MLFPNITKDYILRYLNEEDIMEYYLGVRVVFNELIESPLRPDSTPTCGFYYSKNFNNLRFRDFAGYFWGDCFDVVAYKLNQNPNALSFYNVNYVNPNTSKGFAIILDKIARDFKLNKYSMFSPVEFNSFYSKDYIKQDRPKVHKIQPIFDFDERPFNIYDKEYWGNKYHHTKEELLKTHIYPVKTVYINNFPVYQYENNSDVCYAYYFGKKDGEKQIRFYFPNRKKGKGTRRFMTNNNLVQGALLLDYNKNNKICIVTKSYKDVSCFRNLFFIQAVAPPAESVILTPTQAKILKDNFEYVFIMQDYDNTGIHSMWLHRELYEFQPILFTDNVKRRKIGYKGAKDFSDFLDLHGFDETKKLVDRFIYNTIDKHEEEMNRILNYIKNSV